MTKGLPCEATTREGQRMRGPDGPGLFSFSSSRSKTIDELEASFTRFDVTPQTKKPILNLGDLHGTRAFLIIIRDMADKNEPPYILIALWSISHASPD